MELSFMLPGCIMPTRRKRNATLLKADNYCKVRGPFTPTSQVRGMRLACAVRRIVCIVLLLLGRKHSSLFLQLIIACLLRWRLSSLSFSVRRRRPLTTTGIQDSHNIIP